MKRILYVALFLLVSSLIASAQSTPTSIADISGDGSVHAVASSGFARWIQFSTCTSGATGCTANTNVVRLGDSSISTSRGIPVPPGGTMFFPPLPQTPGNEARAQYDLSKIYYLVQSGDKLSITYGN